MLAKYIMLFELYRFLGKQTREIQVYSYVGLMIGCCSNGFRYFAHLNEVAC